MRPAIILLVYLALSACASDGNVRISGGFGSFGGSGGVGVSGSTDVPVSGHKNPAPFEQLFLSQEAIDATFPTKELPFTATDEDLKTLRAYAGNEGKANISAEDQEKLKSCRSGKARCRIQLLQETSED